MALDYQRVITEVAPASLFELYTLRAAISRLLDDPERIEQVRARLRPGMRVRYFDEAEYRLVEATVIELKRTRLLVENVHDQQRWSILFSAVSLDAGDVAPPPDSPRPAPGPFSWKVGDQVGFRDRQNREVYGRILSLNPKTATVLTSSGQRWRVAYSYLFPVIDAATAGDEPLWLNPGDAQP